MEQTSPTSPSEGDYLAVAPSSATDATAHCFAAATTSLSDDQSLFPPPFTSVPDESAPTTELTSFEATSLEQTTTTYSSSCPYDVPLTVAAHSQEVGEEEEDASSSHAVPSCSSPLPPLPLPPGEEENPDMTLLSAEQPQPLAAVGGFPSSVEQAEPQQALLPSDEQHLTAELVTTTPPQQPNELTSSNLTTTAEEVSSSFAAATANLSQPPGMLSPSVDASCHLRQQQQTSLHLHHGEGGDSSLLLHSSSSSLEQEDTTTTTSTEGLLPAQSQLLMESAAAAGADSINHSATVPYEAAALTEEQAAAVAAAGQCFDPTAQGGTQYFLATAEGADGKPQYFLIPVSINGEAGKDGQEAGAEASPPAGGFGGWWNSDGTPSEAAAYFAGGQAGQALTFPAGEEGYTVDQEQAQQLLAQQGMWQDYLNAAVVAQQGVEVAAGGGGGGEMMGVAKEGEMGGAEMSEEAAGLRRRGAAGAAAAKGVRKRPRRAKGNMAVAAVGGLSGHVGAEVEAMAAGREGGGGTRDLIALKTEEGMEAGGGRVLMGGGNSRGMMSGGAFGMAQNGSSSSSSMMTGGHHGEGLASLAGEGQEGVEAFLPDAESSLPLPSVDEEAAMDPLVSMVGEAGEMFNSSGLAGVAAGLAGVAAGADGVAAVDGTAGGGEEGAGQWVASWVDSNGNAVQRAYSSEIFGAEQARQLAMHDLYCVYQQGETLAQDLYCVYRQDDGTSRGAVANMGGAFAMGAGGGEMGGAQGKRGRKVAAGGPAKARKKNMMGGVGAVPAAMAMMGLTKRELTDDKDDSMSSGPCGSERNFSDGLMGFEGMEGMECMEGEEGALGGVKKKPRKARRPPQQRPPGMGGVDLDLPGGIEDESELPDNVISMKMELYRSADTDAFLPGCKEAYKSGMRGVVWDWNLRCWVANWCDAQGKRVRRHFFAKVYGFEEAKSMAVSCRKEAEESGEASLPRPSSSGVRGVKWYGGAEVWVAYWQVNRKQCHKWFSVRKYGYHEALQMAIEYRKQMEEKYYQ
eukprot:GHVS01050817.1.p1 GENE.GHVS01050817.1~~GHVS01050817.1.p1  ORF type:complete len:1021 (-),score=368.78 GHVS01050817.1:181-3243(-)